MGKRNFLIEGVSGAGKTAVCHELRRRGYRALNGDRDLRHRADSTPVDRLGANESPHIRHAQNRWDVDQVRRLAANQDDDLLFFCGGSRNVNAFSDVFEQVFVLDVDVDTLNKRLDNRLDDDWGKHPGERELILRLHATREDLPATGILIDATGPLPGVVDDILSRIHLSPDARRPDVDR